MKRHIELMNGMAIAVAKASQKIAADFLLVSAALQVTDKSPKSGLPDFVTSTDVLAQRMIGDALARDFPEIPFVGEEGEQRLSKQPAYFLVDPIDGTSNFVALRDYFSCCAAYVENEEVVAAVISDPIRGSIVKAYKGSGVLKTTLDSPLAGIALPKLPDDIGALHKYQLECELAMNSAHHFSIIEAIVPKMSGMRKSGSTALDMANMAMGRRVVLVSDSLEPHDLAAGLLIYREAGGVVTNLTGCEASLSTKSILAGPKNLHQEVMGMLKTLSL